MKSLKFWVEFASTYTYLAVARVARLAAQKGVNVEWEPFYLMPIFKDLGMDQGPFLPFPNKMDYMWRDLERRAARQGTPYRKPSQYPVQSLLTARIATLAAREGWCQPFTEGVFALHWTKDIPIGSDENLHTTLLALGKEPSQVIAMAQTGENKEALKRQTERARELRIFGAPSFTVGTELFWGDDRLEEALDWAVAHPT